MDACECSGGARAGSLRPERHTRKPRAPYGAAGKRSSQRSRNPGCCCELLPGSRPPPWTPRGTTERPSPGSPSGSQVSSVGVDKRDARDREGRRRRGKKHDYVTGDERQER
ncbi:hypothetical protein NDU88_006752 [Pleurodeles waltl]|uniref:Uncharacterized protein n=1 Tax=Pleurodeles waltl TaxID=8319 RepID=A0AAV7RSZ0_PLEWA|nr:hypothetical protein NDU88_006752 [Pleurodeles waltl]